FVVVDQESSCARAVLSCPLCAVVTFNRIARLVSNFISAYIVSIHCCTFCRRQIVVECLFDVFTELSYSVQDRLVNSSLIIWRNVQEECSIVSDRSEIHGSQVCNALRRILCSPPEPSGCDAGISLRNEIG